MIQGRVLSHPWDRIWVSLENGDDFWQWSILRQVHVIGLPRFNGSLLSADIAIIYRPFAVVELIFIYSQLRVGKSRHSMTRHRELYAHIFVYVFRESQVHSRGVNLQRKTWEKMLSLEGFHCHIQTPIANGPKTHPYSSNKSWFRSFKLSFQMEGFYWFVNGGDWW